MQKPVLDCMWQSHSTITPNHWFWDDKTSLVNEPTELSGSFTELFRSMIQGIRESKDVNWNYTKWWCNVEATETASPSPLFFSVSVLPLFSEAPNGAFWLVNSTLEMLRISTNQGPGVPSHSYHSNHSQPQRARTHMMMCTLKGISSWLYGVTESWSFQACSIYKPCL